MLSIPSTLSLHRVTRALYMAAARRARLDADFIRTGVYRPEWWRGEAITKLVQIKGGFLLQPEKAMRCFLRRARLANWKLVAVKRFAREFAVGRENLLQLGDDSVWTDL